MMQLCIGCSFEGHKLCAPFPEILILWIGINKLFCNYRISWAACTLYGSVTTQPLMFGLLASKPWITAVSHRRSCYLSVHVLQGFRWNVAELQRRVGACFTSNLCGIWVVKLVASHWKPQLKSCYLNSSEPYVQFFSCFAECLACSKKDDGYRAELCTTFLYYKKAMLMVIVYTCSLVRMKALYWATSLNVMLIWWLLFEDSFFSDILLWERNL